MIEYVESLADRDAIELTERYGTHNYHPLPVNIVRAKGALAWDGAGNEYVDCIGSYSAVAHGHLSDFIIQTIVDQLKKVSLVSRALYSSELARFMEALCAYSESDMMCPMNSGAEAIETCIKLARKWGYTRKGIPDNQAEIIAVEGNFHGRTTTIIGFSTEDAYKAHFGPFTPGFRVVPYGDIQALRNEVGPNTCGILMEPLLAEGGVIIPPEGYLADVRRLCDQTNTLLMFDEVQTGFCRTGKRFAWQYEDARPDLMAVGKPLGGGFFPVSAALGRKHVMEVFEPGDHGSTFGGNSLGAVIGIAALTEMEVDRHHELAAEMGTRLVEGLRQIQHPAIKDIRGKGLIVGLEVDAELDTKKLSDAFRDNRILTKETRHRTFRFSPPIVVTAEQIDKVVSGTEKALRQAS